MTSREHPYLTADTYPYHLPDPMTPDEWVMDLAHIHPKWVTYLRQEQDHLDLIQQQLAQQIPQVKRLLPPAELVFRSLFWCSPRSIKVVILGQDPYPGEVMVGQDGIGNGRRAIPYASGMSFSAPDGLPIPKSLQTIFGNMVSHRHLPALPKGGDLARWASQGVLLWNTSLTIGIKRDNKPVPHMKLWDQFSYRLLRHLATQQPLVWLVWGGHAHKMCYRVVHDSGIDHYISTSSHPSPLGANSTVSGKEYRTGKKTVYPSFHQTDHFGFVNQSLAQMGRSPIDWELE